MVAWIVVQLLALVAPITLGGFVAEGVLPNFGVIQMMVATFA